jgi:HSP20 family protein
MHFDQGNISISYKQKYKTMTTQKDHTRQAPFSRFIDDLLTTNLGEALESAFVANRAFVNVLESDSAFEVHVAAPGLTKSDFKLEVRDGQLHISSARASQSSDGTAIRSKEFDFGNFHRTFRLDERVDADKITAKYENGVLIVSLAKRIKDSWKKDIPVE